MERINLNQDEGNQAPQIIISNLREKVLLLEEKCEKLEREKTAVCDLLTDKKEDFEDMKDRYRDKIVILEEDNIRLQAEKSRLMGSLKLSSSDKSYLESIEKEILELRKKLQDSEQKCSDYSEENTELKNDIRDIQSELSEIHDQFRDDEAMEFKELQKELENTTKTCRMLQFKIKKQDRRMEELELERNQADERCKQLDVRLRNVGGEVQQLVEIEDELRTAKDVNRKLHDQIDSLEEKKTRLEQELDRVNDLFTNSENKRLTVQSEVDNLKDQLKCNSTNQSITSKIFVPRKDVSGVGVDLQELMRDLSDSLEREHDLKDQLKYSEEEITIMRKKLAELEEENDSMGIQLSKLTNAKTTWIREKNGARGSNDKTKDGRIVLSESENEMKMQKELAESEVTVLRRKLEDTESLYDILLEEVRDMKSLVLRTAGEARAASADRTDASYEDKVHQLAFDIEKLKIKLLERNTSTISNNVSSINSRNSKSNMQKSKSLEDPEDRTSMLEESQRELRLTKERLTLLERKQEIHQQQINNHVDKVNTTSDSSVLNGRVQELEKENIKLRESLGFLDERAKKLSNEVVKAKFGSGWTTESSNEWREIRSQVQKLEDEKRQLKRNVSNLEVENSRLASSGQNIKNSNTSSLRDDAQYDRLQKELDSSKLLLKNRDEEIEHLEEEIVESREDLNRILESFKRRERELTDDLDLSKHKHEMLSDLLRLITERAENAEKEAMEVKTNNMVFTNINGKKDDDTSLKKRCEILEMQIAEERSKFEKLEKKVIVQPEKKEFKKQETDILQQELNISQKQLKAANDQILNFKQRLVTLQNNYDVINDDYAKLLKETEEKAKGTNSTPQVNVTLAPLLTPRPTSLSNREPASWRWEKQELEKQLKELRKKLDDSHSEMKRSQIKWKAAGEDIERENQIKDELERKIQKLKSENEQFLKTIETHKSKIDEIHEAQKQKEKHWDREKLSLQESKMAAEKEAKQKNDIIVSKDDIIKQKNLLIKEKDEAIKERDRKLEERENKIISFEQQIKESDKLEANLKELEASFTSKDSSIKELDEQIRRRDDRIKEKDDILQQLNRKLSEKTSQVSDMDQTIRQIIRKLQARDCDLSLCRQNLKRSQTDLRLAQDQLQEKVGLQESGDMKIKIEKLTKELKIAEEKFKKDKELLEKSNENLELKNQQLEEKIHCQELAESLPHSEAYKQLLREKEMLISEKFQMRSQSERLTRQIDEKCSSAQTQILALTKELEEKKKNIEELKNAVARKSQRPESLIISNLTSPLLTDHSDVAKTKLQQQEAKFNVEKNTLEEFYEASSQNLKYNIEQLEQTNISLRRESEGQLKLLHSSRKMLQDLRTKYDNDVTEWQMERSKLLAIVYHVGESSKRFTDAQEDLIQLSARLDASESKKKEMQARFLLEESMWMDERNNLEDKIKQLQEDRDDVNKAGNTRVSEFRARFEKMGKPKKGESPGESYKTKEVIDKITRDLQDQVDELIKARLNDQEKLKKMYDERTRKFEEDINHLRQRCRDSDAKECAIQQLERDVSEQQEKWMEDMNMMEEEKIILSKQAETFRKEIVQHRDSINRVYAEIKRLRFLISSLEGFGSLSPQTETSTRSRSLTSSAEKLRLQNVKFQILKPNTLNVSQPNEELIQDISQVFDNVSKMADELNNPNVNMFDAKTDQTIYKWNSSSDVKSHFNRSSNQIRGFLTPSTPSSRTPAYVSGTKSAFASRDASPDKVGTVPKVLSKAPSYARAPSTPSNTPKYGNSFDRSNENLLGGQSGQVLTTEDILRIYERLDAIKTSDRRPDLGSKLHIRGSFIKSASVDASENIRINSSIETKPDIPAPVTPGSSGADTTPKSSKRISLLKSFFPNKPGQQDEGVQIKKKDKRSASASPRTARRRFFESFDSRLRKKSEDREDGDSRDGNEDEIDRTNEKAIKSSSNTSLTDQSKFSSSKIAGFLHNVVKDRRNMFAGKKSASVDTSLTGASIAHIGANILSEPAAPSTYKPPDIGLSEDKKVRPKKKKVPTATLL